MKPVYTTRDTCRLCGSHNLATVATLPDSPAGDDFVSDRDAAQPTCPVEMQACLTCGQVQLRHIFAPELIYTNYTYRTANSLGLVKHFEEYASQLIEHEFALCGAQRFVVEIGSNAGDLLKALAKHGFRVLGVDPAREIAAQATRDGVPTICDYFSLKLAEQIRAGYGPASLVIANNVLANIDDLADVFEGARHLIDKHGLFVFETSYLMDVLNQCLIDTCFHEHLSYLSVAPLMKFCRAHGLELVRVEHVDTKGGSIRCYVRHLHGEMAISSNVLDFLIAEDFGRAQLRGWEAWNARVAAMRFELGDLLRAYRAEGNTICAYGASDGCTEMIYALDLAPYLDFILDDNPGKISRYSPGHHIEVMASGQIVKADVCVILAWRYRDNILKLHPEFRGRWVDVMPTIEVH